MIKKIILITIDSLRADFSYPIVSSVSRILDKVVYKTVFANGPGTPQAFPAILASSSFLVLNSNFSLPSHVKTLPEVLSKYNFITVGIHSNPYLSRIFGWYRGFKIFYDYYDEISSPLFSIMKSRILHKMISMLARNKHIHTKIIPKLSRLYQSLISLRISKPPYIDAKKITCKAMDVLKLYKDKHLFLWIHYMDTHWPYNVPDTELVIDCGFHSTKQALKYLFRIPISFMSSNKPLEINISDLSKLKCLYKKSIIYVATNIKRLLQVLEEIDVLNETLIVITSDHGEAFLEHGMLGHPFNTLYNENLRVPLIVWHPCRKHSPNRMFVQHRELAPWILNMLNINKLPRSWLATRSLVREFIFAESAYVNPFTMTIYKDKYIISAIHSRYKIIVDKFKNTVELYDLRVDPYERNNLANILTDVVKELKQMISEYYMILKASTVLHAFKAKITNQH